MFVIKVVLLPWWWDQWWKLWWKGAINMYVLKAHYLIWGPCRLRLYQINKGIAQDVENKTLIFVIKYAFVLNIQNGLFCLKDILFNVIYFTCICFLRISILMSQKIQRSEMLITDKVFCEHQPCPIVSIFIYSFISPLTSRHSWLKM